MPSFCHFSNSFQAAGICFNNVLSKEPGAVIREAAVSEELINCVGPALVGACPETSKGSLGAAQLEPGRRSCRGGCGFPRAAASHAKQFRGDT